MHCIFTYMWLMFTVYAGKYTVDAIGMNMRHIFHHKAYLLGPNIDHYEDDFPFPRWDLFRGGYQSIK